MEDVAFRLCPDGRWRSWFCRLGRDDGVMLSRQREQHGQRHGGGRAPGQWLPQKWLWCRFSLARSLDGEVKSWSHARELRPQAFMVQAVEKWKWKSVLSDSLQPHGRYSPWNSPGQDTGVGGLSLLQGIFPTQGLNPGLPHYGQILY